MKWNKVEITRRTIKQTFFSVFLGLLCLLFNSLVSAEMSDQEKQEFIESLAEPSKEKKIFYRWQTEQAETDILQAGRMEPGIYRYFKQGVIHAAEDIISSSSFGETLIQIEVEPGYRFLNLFDETVRRKLREKGISDIDLYRLSPKIAYKNQKRTWWMFHEHKGIEFKPFSSHEIKLLDLKKVYRDIEPSKKKYFTGLIQGDILSRAEKYPDVFITDLIEIVEEAYGREYVKEKVLHHSRHISTFEEGTAWLLKPAKYLSESDKKRIVENTMKFPINNRLSALAFLIATKEYLSEPEKAHIMEKTLPLIQSKEELEPFRDIFSDSEYEEFQKKFQNQNQIPSSERNTDNNTRQNTYEKTGSGSNKKIECLRRLLNYEE